MFREATLNDKDTRAFDYYGRSIGWVTDTRHHSAGVLTKIRRPDGSEHWGFGAWVSSEETAVRAGKGVKYQCTKCKQWFDAADFDAHVRGCKG